MAVEDLIKILLLFFIVRVSCDRYENGICLLRKYSCGPCFCEEEHRLLDKYYCDCQHLQPTKDCLAFLNRGFTTSGIYVINPRDGVFIQVFCDQNTAGGGWIVFQRRMDGSINFYRNWVHYKRGFGAPQHEFWLGNDYLTTLTTPKAELRIDMKYWKEKSYYASYNSFHVSNEKQNYTIHVSGYRGNIGDTNRRGFGYSTGKSFSTYDRDNDVWGDNCAEQFKGGWWYGNCHATNLNGRYFHYKDKFPFATGIHWRQFDHFNSSMSFVEMKLRRR